MAGSHFYKVTSFFFRRFLANIGFVKLRFLEFLTDFGLEFWKILEFWGKNSVFRPKKATLGLKFEFFPKGTPKLPVS